MFETDRSERDRGRETVSCSLATSLHEREQSTFMIVSMRDIAHGV